MKIRIAIKSCHKYAARQQAQRDTWLKNCDVEYAFLVGDSSQGCPSFDCGRLHCPSSDAFADIAPKVRYACVRALQENVTHLFICDDDTYVRPERLLLSEYQEHDYIGFVRNYGNCPYMQGSSFWLSSRAMQYIVNHPEKMPNGVPDDVAVGAALYGKVHFVHEHRFAVGDPYPQRTPLASNNIISSHKHLPDSMYRVHEAWLVSQK